MPNWLSEFLGFAKTFNLGSAIWDYFMSLVLTLMGLSPEDFSPGAWTYVTGILYPWFLSIGVVLLNMFCLIGFIRQAANLRENVTIEMWIELFIKTIIANVLMVNGISLMKDFFKAAGLLSTDIMITETPHIYSSEVDAGAIMAYIIFGLIYLIASLVCGIIITLEVLARFLNLYMLVAVAPVMLSTWAGGRGLENTAYAWIKSFLTTVFQIVVIALVLQIGSKMIQATALTNKGTMVGNWFDGFGAVLLSFVTMIFMTTAVKGADNFLKRVADLR